MIQKPRKRMAKKTRKASMEQIIRLASQKVVVTVRDIVTEVGLNENQARASLRSLAREGILREVRPGMFAPVSKPSEETPLTLTTRLRKPQFFQPDEGLLLLTPYLLNPAESVSLLQFADRTGHLYGRFKNNVKEMMAFFDAQMPPVVRHWWPSLLSSPSHLELTVQPDNSAVSTARLLAVTSELKKGTGVYPSFAQDLALKHAESFNQEFIRKAAELADAIRSEILTSSDSLGTFERFLEYISRQALLGLDLKTIINDEMILKAIRRAGEKLGLRVIERGGAMFLSSQRQSKAPREKKIQAKLSDSSSQETTI